MKREATGQVVFLGLKRVMTAEVGDREKGGVETTPKLPKPLRWNIENRTCPCPQLLGTL